MSVGGKEVRQHTLHSVQPGGAGFFLTGDVVQPLVGGEQTDGQSSLSRITVLPGSGQILHRHAQHETLYILDGEVQFQGAKNGTIRNFAGGQGTLLHFPGCVPHSYFNASPHPATLLSFTTPGGLDSFYARAGQQVECTADAAHLVPDNAHIESIGWEFGIEPIDAELYDSREGYRASGAHYVPTAHGRSYLVLDSMVRILADTTQTEGWLTVLEITQRAAGEAPMHRHPGACTSYVLDGVFGFTGQAAEGRKTLAAAGGTALYRSAGMSYGFRNNAPGSSRMLAFITPAGIEDFVRAVGRELSSPDEYFRGDWPAPTPEELARVTALASQLGVEIQ
jgi:quercetin dioxygenase-like cupin family protein